MYHRNLVSHQPPHLLLTKTSPHPTTLFRTHAQEDQQRRRDLNDTRRRLKASRRHNETVARNNASGRLGVIAGGGDTDPQDTHAFLAAYRQALLGRMAALARERDHALLAGSVKVRPLTTLP